MKLRPVARPIPLEVPAIIAKRATGGAGWRGADEYASGKDGAELLSTSLEGKTPRERSREIARLLAGSRLKRHCDHWSLSVDPRLGKLSDDQWRQAAEVFLKRMTYEGCAYTLTRHVDTKVDHCHLLILRRRGDGSTVSDSNDFKRGHAAAVAAAESLGIKPLPPRPDAARLPAPTDSQVAANKRATARGTKVQVQDYGSLARVFEYLVSKSSDLAELQERAAEAGLELEIKRKSGGAIQGLNVKFLGAQEWCKASELKTGSKIERPLAWSKVEIRLAENAELRARAQAQAASAVAQATTRAAQQADARLARQRTPEVPQVPRALTPEAVATMKEKIVNEQNDPLSFLSSESPQPRPPGQRLDDAGLAPVTTSSSPPEPPAQTEEDDRTRREQIELAAAELELDNSFRRMTFDELLDLKNAKIPPVLITAAQWLALLNLITRIFSFGLLRGSNSFAESISAKEALAARAQAEVGRRKKSPASVQERFRVLSAFEKSARARVLELDARVTKGSVAKAHGIQIVGKHTREELEAGFDRLQVSLQKPTLGALKLALAEAEARVARRRARVDADTELSGMFGLRRPRGTAAKAAAARVAALATARRERDAAQRALDSANDAIAAEQVRERLGAAEAAKAVGEAELQERESLELELGVGQPAGLSAARRQLDNEARTERISGVVRDAAEVDGDTDAERAAARQAWLDLIRKGG